MVFLSALFWVSLSIGERIIEYHPLTLIAGRHGLGKHVWAVGLDDVTTLMKVSGIL